MTVDPGVVETEIKNLRPATKYSFDITAETAEGLSHTSSPVVATTLESGLSYFNLLLKNPVRCLSKSFTML